MQIYEIRKRFSNNGKFGNGSNGFEQFLKSPKILNLKWPCLFEAMRKLSKHLRAFYLW